MNPAKRKKLYRLELQKLNNKQLEVKTVQEEKVLQKEQVIIQEQSLSESSLDLGLKVSETVETVETVETKKDKKKKWSTQDV